MRLLKVKVDNIRQIKKDVYLISFVSPYIEKEAHPGQFLHIKIKDTLLRRPFSIHNVEGKNIYVLFKIKGIATRRLANYKKGELLDILGPLGKGFSLKGKGKYILIAGGMGVAPLYFLGKRLISQDFFKIVILGGRTKEDVLYEKEFKNLGYRVFVTTEDGSRGFKGRVDEQLKELIDDEREFLSLYACGPKGMFKSLALTVKGKPFIDMEFSFEQFMGCGIGVCCACVILTNQGYKKVCKDGPVFNLKNFNQSALDML
ncbi:MAG: dihydroorotate dehydrogenase electron transfer subunit [Candidatus Omnitrophica bacterium]|nr:dihydroorotate dehydrogenase electron transfer subunit [Candidatus Omnitrophota bacterium]